jgi:predicted RNase H-like HicB family nuclease
MGGATSEAVERDITEEELAEARRYSLLIQWSNEDRVYIVSVPELPGCRTHSATHIEAVEMGAEAIATYLAGLRHFGDPVPPPRVVVGSTP